MKCSKCGFDVKPNEKFCGHCGEKAPDNSFLDSHGVIPSAAPEASMEFMFEMQRKPMECGKCGSDMKPNEKFCKHCGEKAPDDFFSDSYGVIPSVASEASMQFAHCKPEMQSKPMECGKCGSDMKPNEKFCKRCGKKASSEMPRKQRNIRELRIIVLQTLNSIILAALLFCFPFFEKFLLVNSSDSNNFLFGEFSLLHVIGSLVLGSGRYSPSVPSISMGLAVIIFVFASSLFWLISSATTIIRKGQNGIRRMSVIVTFLALGFVCALPSLAYMFIPQFKLIYARAGGVLLEDLSSITSPVSYVWAGIVVLLMIGTWILKGRRNHGKGTAEENEK